MDETQRDTRERLLDTETINLILRDYVKVDGRARLLGKTVNKWEGKWFPPIGSEVCAFGNIGVVCDYGIQETEGSVFWRCLWVRFGSDLVKAIESEVAMVSDEDKVAQDKEFKERLVAAGKKVEQQKKERRARTVKGSHLVDEMVEMASLKYTVDKKSSFYKVTGSLKGRAVYVAVKGGRVDISGFDTKNDFCVARITPEEAKKRHLGRVRGQMNFTMPDNSVMDAFANILKELNDG